MIGTRCKNSERLGPRICAKTSDRSALSRSRPWIGLFGPLVMDPAMFERIRQGFGATQVAGAAPPSNTKLSRLTRRADQPCHAVPEQSSRPNGNWLADPRSDSNQARAMVCQEGGADTRGQG